ncbi:MULTISPECIES: GNAT family N-acetyltransferase [Ramlibacter]|uniref:GNAT family N-acetyltransferase n=1 Tax=Ramlibacter aquaticus TaxID=2780094 RepID=A0ABR9SDB7_9BURK|nr:MULTISPECIES: GNAT family N-acetyltransferase [Ramlibacter]MBE7940347.1 GNAT family N-acetyltransferase [Ramlibacter aquaticus]
MRLRSLSLPEAQAFQQALGCERLPGTLSPCYLAGDALRDAALSPRFVAVEEGERRWLHGLHLTDIPGSRWRDASSPYGYGGPVANSRDAGFLVAAWQACHEHLRGEERVVVEYLRFHPLLANEAGYPGQVLPNREVVSVDLTTDFAAAYPLRLQQVLRKSARAGLHYGEQPFAPQARAFGAYHRAAMQAMGADAFYVFDDAYFEAMGRCPGARLALVTADGAWLAAALLLDGPGVREYHLAATVPEGRRLGASSALLHGAAEAARDAGLRQLYLGGGTDAKPDNPLLFFKGGFSPLRLPYRTGSRVLDPAGYDEVKALFAAQHAAHPQRPIFHRKV